MRHIDKGPEPDILRTEGTEFQNAALNFATHRGDAGVFTQDLKKYAVYIGPDFAHYASGLFTKYSFYSNPTVKRQLITEHAGKCAFCESFIMDTDVGDVEHFRPKAEVTMRDRNDARIEVSVADHPGYFWLSATWANLYLSCKQCNQAYKKNFFDVWPDTPRTTPISLDVVESPLLLSPEMSDDVLRRLIRYDPATAEALRNPEDPFGELPEPAKALPRITRTIEIVGLNRPRLVEARANHLVKLRTLFVLVANEGGMAVAEQPRVTDKKPAILDFVVEPDTAAADALGALKRAVDRTAEFSALALDALIVWSTELKFQEPVAYVALEQQNHIHLQTEKLRINKQIARAEGLCLTNAASSEAEAQPGTEDLDSTYNALLQKYKTVIVKIGTARDELGVGIQKRNDLSEERRKIREGNGVGEAEDTYQTAIGDRDEERAAELRRRMNENPLKQLIEEDSARLTEIERIEAPLDKYFFRLNDINEDLVDVAEAYRIRGTSRAARGARCEQLTNAIDSAMAWLDDGTGPSQEVLHHMDGRGFPPAIRK